MKGTYTRRDHTRAAKRMPGRSIRPIIGGYSNEGEPSVPSFSALPDLKFDNARMQALRLAGVDFATGIASYWVGPDRHSLSRDHWDGSASQVPGARSWYSLPTICLERHRHGEALALEEERQHSQK